MHLKIIVIFFAVQLLTSCSTGYKEMGFGGGVTAEQVSSDTFRIKARGNGFTSKSKVEDFVMMKAAEITLQSGGTHFFLSNTRDASRNATIQSPTYVDTVRTRHGAHSVIKGGEITSIYNPGQDSFVKILLIKEGEVIPSGVYSAKEVVQFTGARLNKKNALGL